MKHWIIETHAGQSVLIHYCRYAENGIGKEVLRQDIGGGYVRCDLCGEKFLPPTQPHHPRLILKLQPLLEDSVAEEEVASF